MLSFEQERAEAIDAILLFGVKEVTTSLSSKD